MAGVATLVLKVVTDTTAAAKDIDATSSRMDRFKSSMRAAAIPAGIAGAAVLAFGKKAIDAASATQQAMGGVEAVFGKNAKTVEAWANSAADAVGLSASEFGNLATLIGSQLKNMGLPMDQVTEKTHQLIKLGADLAATYGGTTAEAVQALSATLRGETDPIERYGVSIKQADIAAQQAKDGTDKLTGAAGKQAKTMATLGLITKQTSAAQGQFAREADTAAGQQQRASAAMANAMSDIGTTLLPVVAKASELLATLATWMSKNAALVRVLLGVVLGLAGAVLAVNAAIAIWEAAVAVATAAQWAWNAAMAANPIGLIVLAVAALVAGLVLLFVKSKKARDAMRALWDGAKQAFSKIVAGVKAAAGWVSDAFRKAASVAKTVWSAFSGWWRGLWSSIKAVVSNVLSWLRDAFRTVFSVVRAIVLAYLGMWRTVFAAVRDAVVWVIDKVRSGLGGAISWLIGKVRPLTDLLTAPFKAMEDAIGWAIDKVSDLIGWISKIHLPDLGGVLGKIPGLGMAAPPVTGPAPAVLGPRGLGARGRAGGSSASGGVTINVNGALDPEAVARQIQRILANHNRRVGLVAS